MGQFDYLIPGSSAAAPKASGPVGGQFAYLVPKAAPPPAPITPGPINRAIAPVIGGAQKFGSDVIGALTGPSSDTTSGPVQLKSSTSAADDAALATINTYANTFKDATDRFGTAFSTALDSHASALQKGVAAGEAGMGALNLAFAPISAFLNGTSRIPVVGALSTGINKVFSAIGAGGSDYGEGAIAALPVSDNTKAALTPLAKEIGALTAQIIAGKGSEESFKKVQVKTGQFMDAVHKDVVRPITDSAGKTIETNPITKLPVYGDTTLRPLSVAGESVETPITPANKYTPNEELPTIQMGGVSKDTSGLPSIQASESARASKTGDYTVEPIRESVGTVTKEQPSAAMTPRVENAPVVPTEHPSAEMPTKGALDINENLVKEAQAPLSPEEMATYKSGSYKSDAETGRILKEQDPEALKQMAITGKGIPEGVYPKILYNIVEKDAVDSKDYALQRELAGSPLHTGTSEHAGGLGSAGYNKVNNSPVDVLRDAIKRKAGGEKGTKEVAAEAKKAKSTITKAAAKMIDYKSIIDAIKTC